MRRHIISLLVGVSVLTGVAIASPSTLNDIEGHWAKTSIEKLVSLEAINGYEDGTFRPDKNITREEVVKILGGIMPTTIVDTEDGGFVDVSGRWSALSIAKLTEKGYIKGYSDDEFKPTENMTRAELVAVISRYMEDESIKKIESVGEEFSDTAGHWAANDINKVASSGLINGYGEGLFKPNNKISRAETAKIINSLIELRSRIDSGEEFSEKYRYLRELILKTYNDSADKDEFMSEYLNMDFEGLSDVEIDKLADYTLDLVVEK